jgi:hypothetical protein
LRPEDARLGKRVVVTSDYRKPELRGTKGVIVGSYGNPDYLALDVKLESGVTELFWHHQLEETDDELQSVAVGG